MTVLMLIIFIFAVLFAAKSFANAFGFIAMGRGVLALLGFLMTIVWAVIAILVWVYSLKERLTGDS